MTDIFREVEEDLRRERLNRFWGRYGLVVVGLAVLVVLGVAGWRIYEHRAATRAAASSDRYAQALLLGEQGKHAEAAEALSAIAGAGEGGYSTLARFRAAAERAAAGDRPAAIAAFDAIADDGSAAPEVRELARVRAANLAVETGSREDVARRVEPLAVAGNAWRHSARELLGLAAWKAGDTTAAERWFAEASNDPEAPQGVKSRADLFLTLIAGAPRPVPGGPAAGATN